MVDPLRAKADDANRRVYMEAATRSGGSVEEVDGLVLVTGTHPLPVIANVAFRVLEAATSADATDILGRVERHFSRVGHGASLMTSDAHDADLDAAAMRAGWHLATELPVMLLEARVPERSRDDVSMSWVGTERDVRSFREVLASGFADDEDERGMVRAMFASPATLEPPGVRGILAAADGEVVGAGAVYRSGEIAVVGWITVVESHRGRGLGTEITATLANAAFADGAAGVALQASPMGFAVYERMGFRAVGRDRIWFPPPHVPTPGSPTGVRS